VPCTAGAREGLDREVQRRLRPQAASARRAGRRQNGFRGGMARDKRKKRNQSQSWWFVGDGEERMRMWLNEHGFSKQKTCRCRGRRDEPRDGNGFRRGWLRRPKKLAELSLEKFAGSEIQNFGDWSAGLRAAARNKGCTSGISASRATPVYI